MDSPGDSDNAVRLKTSLEEGPPLPNFVIADLRSRDVNRDIVMDTTKFRIRLTTSDVAEEWPNERTLSLTPPTPTVDTIYPGIKLDNRYYTCS